MLISDINGLSSDFVEDERNCFDGNNFVIVREHTFWLECECKSLSRQLSELELQLNDFPDIDGELGQSRQCYYLYSRDQ